METEIWKDIEEFKDKYQVSNLGRVRSKERFINTRTYPSVIMKPLIRNNNSVQVHLRDGIKQVSRSVAKLVLLTFVGKPPANAQHPRHLDGNPNNNRLDNLEWNVNRAYGLPTNQKSREWFNAEAERMIEIYIKYKRYSTLSFGEADIDDFKQECLIAIWNIIDMVEDCSNFSLMFGLVKKKCDWVMKKFYKKYKNRHRYTYFSQMTGGKSDMEFSENMIELSCVEYYDR